MGERWLLGFRREDAWLWMVASFSLALSLVTVRGFERGGMD